MAAPAGEAGFARTNVSGDQAWEETFFLGLRLNRGVDLSKAERRFGQVLGKRARDIIAELHALELVELRDHVVSLTPSGRLLSNEVFQRFLNPANQVDDVVQLVPLASTKIQ
jgi:oxygen-independent coproporphyrinogen III oxidase